MKFAVCLLLACMSLIGAQSHHEKFEKVWGNVHAHELGTHVVKVPMSDTKHTVHEFTYPKVPSQHKIVGVKLIDYNPDTQVDFVKGYFGDHQLTIKVTAYERPIESHFVFYYEY